ncbi:MAG: acpS [Jatrophihabitans sp.]|nr:acpS [Jatrophihabitans sp.]
MTAAPVAAGLRIRSGVDLVAVSDVDNAITQFGQRYLDRVFTAHEIESCAGLAQRVAEGLAARFAAKEAAIKVLRPRDTPLDWRSIEVRRDADGICTLQLSGTALLLAEQAGIVDISVALSHEGDIATAMVVALCATPPEDLTSTTEREK